jgi:mannose-1-phosphate guanylyltransferase
MSTSGSTSDAADVLERLWAIVPAGGAGTRLWPLSRSSSPKFLHDLTGQGRTLIQATVDRLAPVVADRVVVVTGRAHEDAVRAQLPGVERVLAEPSPRDSMAAIGLAAAILEREVPDALVASFAADHVISGSEEFLAAVREAAAVADRGWLVTIGIEPTHPATGFGYVRAGEALDGFPTARAVREFVEKPDAERARAYLAAGDYRWNGGMFVARASVLLDLLAEQHPDLAEGLRLIAGDPSSLEERWPELTRIAIDHAVAEPAAAAGRVATVPGAFAWEDIGDFAALAGQGPGEGLHVLGDPALVVGLDATGIVVAAGGRTVAIVGLEDVVVVDTGDALLVTTLDRAQDVRSVVDLLKSTGRSELT